MWRIFGAMAPALRSGWGEHKQMLSVVSDGTGDVYLSAERELAKLLTGHRPGYTKSAWNIAVARLQKRRSR